MKTKLSILIVSALLCMAAFAYAQDDVKTAAKDTGKATDTAAKKTGHGIKKGTKAVGHGVKKGAEKTGDAVK
jgi:hypothetical protein